MIRLVLALMAALGLAACANNPESAPRDVVARAVYHDPGAPELVLYTVVNNTSGSGAHSALLINASQRVIFDPAGSFHHADTPRAGDVLFGITPAFSKAYESMHARPEYHVLIQPIPVSAEVAELALQKALASGPVGAAMCAQSTSGLLQSLPGFGGVKRTFFPLALASNVADVTGVQGRRYYEGFTPPGGS